LVGRHQSLPILVLRNERLVNHHVVQESEEGAIVILPVEPLEKGPLDQLVRRLEPPLAPLFSQHLPEIAAALPCLQALHDDLLGRLLEARGPGVLAKLETLVEVFRVRDVGIGGKEIGGVAVVLKDLGQGIMALVQERVLVVGAVLRGIEAGEHGAMGRHRGSARGGATLEDPRAFGPLIDEGRGGLVVSVEAHPVGARRVPHHEEHVRPVRSRIGAGDRGEGHGRQCDYGRDENRRSSTERPRDRSMGRAFSFMAQQSHRLSEIYF
jgi:hypothetical protein